MYCLQNDKIGIFDFRTFEEKVKGTVLKANMQHIIAESSDGLCASDDFFCLSSKSALHFYDFQPRKLCTIKLQEIDYGKRVFASKREVIIQRNERNLMCYSKNGESRILPFPEDYSNAKVDFYDNKKEHIFLREISKMAVWNIYSGSNYLCIDK